ncbi:DUF397 domain-containing protein [Streptomyces sp. NPDC008159]|uniref:DUF397 domain-containing protein n=1 Tax=Streptomyces sp. NPDC008159 TaxID=3364817 RepID=UPI0036E073AD
MTESNWQRSSFCGGGGNNCIEVSGTPSGVALRESEAPAEVLTTDRGVMQALILGVKAGSGPSPAPMRSVGQDR